MSPCAPANVTLRPQPKGLAGRGILDGPPRDQRIHRDVGGVPTGSAGVSARIPGTRNSGGAPLSSSLNSYEMHVAFTSWGFCG